MIATAQSAPPHHRWLKRQAFFLDGDADEVDGVRRRPNGQGGGRRILLQRQIDLFPVADADDYDHQPLFFFLENYPVTADSQSVIILICGELFNIIFESLRIFGEDQEFFLDDSLVSPVDPLEIVQGFSEELKIIHLYIPKDFQTFSASRSLSRPFSRSLILFLASFRSIRSK